MIAYVDSNKRLTVANDDGTGAKPIEAPGRDHTWPVWAPDGSRLAFSSFASGSNGRGLMGLYVHELGDAPASALYENEPGSDAISSGTFHYALWSPDASRIALIAGTLRSGLTLFVVDPARPDPPIRLIEGGPLFMSWSPDSRFLLVHRGPDHHIADFQEEIRAAEMPGRSRLYMSPSWSPTSNRMAIMREKGGGEQTLLIGEIPEGEASLITEADGPAAFAWSPDGKDICVARDQRPGERFYGSLWLVPIDVPEETRLSVDPVLAFYWSPNGQEIAYVTPSAETEGSLRWGVLDVATSTARYYADFRPTEEQLTAFMYFDQYAQSHNPWSPDGRRLLFCGALGRGEEGVGLPGPHEASALVLDVKSDQPPAPVAAGFLAFWSPHDSPPSNEP
jgi:TolB protein